MVHSLKHPLPSIILQAHKIGHYIKSVGHFVYLHITREVRYDVIFAFCKERKSLFNS